MRFSNGLRDGFNTNDASRCQVLHEADRHAIWQWPYSFCQGAGVNKILDVICETQPARRRNNSEWHYDSIIEESESVEL